MAQWTNSVEFGETDLFLSRISFQSHRKVPSSFGTIQPDRIYVFASPLYEVFFRKPAGSFEVQTIMYVGSKCTLFRTSTTYYIEYCNSGWCKGTPAPVERTCQLYWSHRVRIFLPIGMVVAWKRAAESLRPLCLEPSIDCRPG